MTSPQHGIQILIDFAERRIAGETMDVNGVQDAMNAIRTLRAFDSNLRSILALPHEKPVAAFQPETVLGATTYRPTSPGYGAE